MQIRVVAKRGKWMLERQITMSSTMVDSRNLWWTLLASIPPLSNYGSQRLGWVCPSSGLQARP